MGETWKSIQGYDDYQVSDQGGVRSHKSGEWRALKPGTDSRGYLRVLLCASGGRKLCRVHRLVLETFVGPCPEGHECNHGDGDKRNNRKSNLEWVTGAENTAHAINSGLMRTLRGESVGGSKLTEELVIEIRRLDALGNITKVALGAMFGVTGQHVGSIVRRKRWKHI